MIKYFLTLLISLIAFSVFTQEVISMSGDDAKKAFLEQKKELDGVFQVQFIKVRGKLALTSKLLNFIKENQKDTEDVIVNYSKTIRLVILSKQNVINNNLFSESEKVIYVKD